VFSGRRCALNGGGGGGESGCCGSEVGVTELLALSLLCYWMVVYVDFRSNT